MNRAQQMRFAQVEERAVLRQKKLAFIQDDDDDIAFNKSMFERIMLICFMMLVVRIL